MSETLVRPLAPGDEARWRALWRGYQEFYEIDLAESTTAELFRRLLDAEAPFGCFVAERDGEVVGIANYVFVPDTWDPRPNCYLNDVYVEPSLRGGGVGRALIEAVKARAEEEDCPLLWWLTAPDNTRAQGLYDQLAELDTFRRYEVKLRDITGGS